MTSYSQKKKVSNLYTSNYSDGVDVDIDKLLGCNENDVLYGNDDDMSEQKCYSD